MMPIVLALILIAVSIVGLVFDAVRPGMLLLMPLITCAAIVIAPARQAKWTALVGSTLVFVYSVLLAMLFDRWTTGGFDFNARVPWLEKFGILLQMRADSISMWLVLLTTLLVPLCVWGSFSSIHQRQKEYYGWLLVLLTAMLGVFLAGDIIFFYVSFEFTLIPMYFLIAIYGSDNRSRAAIKFFLYTFTGSVITLAGLIYVAWRYRVQSELGMWNFEIEALTTFAARGLSPTEQAWILLALLAGFAVKVPLFPVHTWLPLAHTEAPTAGSVILAGVLLKLGTYGLYRFVLPMVPDAVIEYAPLIATLSIVGIIYGGLVCWVQSDVKKLVAYSSVSHLGFCVLGLFALNSLGVQGSVLYMINHGLSTGALFFCVGMMYERYHTRQMDQIGGLARRMPVWAFFTVFFALSSVGLPGLNGFVSEFLCLIGTFTSHAENATYPGRLGPWYAAAAATGMIIAAMYLLYMVGRIVFGPLKEPHDNQHGRGGAHDTHPPADLTWREIGVLTPLAILCLYIGIKPAVFTDTLATPIETMLVDQAQYPRRMHELGFALNAEEIYRRGAEITEGALNDSEERMQAEALGSRKVSTIE
jgi:NADH-quinone oxidoreductase subunit M